METNTTEKLNREHLAPYLMHSLKVIMEGKKCNVAWMSTKNIAVIRPEGIGEVKKINWKYAHLNVKPILIPLSDLTIEDAKEHNYPDEGHLTRSIESGHAPYSVWIEFVKYKFDVFGLIEKGLAISIHDINTLKQNT